MLDYSGDFDNDVIERVRQAFATVENWMETAAQEEAKRLVDGGEAIEHLVQQNIQSARNVVSSLRGSLSAMEAEAAAIVAANEAAAMSLLTEMLAGVAGMGLIAGFEFSLAYYECGWMGVQALLDALNSGNPQDRIRGAVIAYGCIDAGLGNLPGANQLMAAQGGQGAKAHAHAHHAVAKFQTQLFTRQMRRPGRDLTVLAYRAFVRKDLA